MKDAELRCRCGEVHGYVRNASPQTVNRVVCYCDDCQAFAHLLGRADLLDPNGGSDIVQVAPSALEFDRGKDRISGVRLGPKGLYRWYASCCKTPIGNTVGLGIPFVGIAAQNFETEPGLATELFGKPVGKILGKFAVGTAPPGSKDLNLGLIMRAIRMILGWKFRGQTWPHPFFDRETKQPAFPLRVVSPAERDALRPLCGPTATAVVVPSQS